jgi:carbamoyltransferase
MADRLDRLEVFHSIRCDSPACLYARHVACRLSAVFGRWGPRHPHLARWGGRATRTAVDALLSRRGLHSPDSNTARARLAAVARAIERREEAYILGFGAASHNSGAALVRVSREGRVDLICNEEEERYTAIKHCQDYPQSSIEAIKRHMHELDIGPDDIVACVGTFDYAQAVNAQVMHPFLEELPRSLSMLAGVRSRKGPRKGTTELAQAPARLREQLGSAERMPIIGTHHHDTHAYLCWGVSPFADVEEPVMVVIIDGGGDDACTSLYIGQSGRLTLLDARGSNYFDSLGNMYAFLSSTQGGWPQLSSEGRYMGAAAWGDNSRLTNRYYRRLRQIFYYGPEGEVNVNRALANWIRAPWTAPYTDELTDILGEAIPVEKMWDPDAILNVEDTRHPEITRDRVDKAAAVQLAFEDALLHVIDHMIRATGSHRLVLTGGTALNCVANMRLLESFDTDWYARNLGQSDTRLHLWVPPIPGDAGSPVGAAYAFAMRAGARPGTPLQHAFYCGFAPTTSSIRTALKAEPVARSMALGDCSDPETRERVADFLAYAVANDRIIGLYQGASETGPRALGHRSILANPCNPDTRRLLNERVKYRELIRPLAPMLTQAAAERFFHLEQGASDGDYNAYNYMVITARARPGAHDRIPAVIHRDGTGRLQIVRPDIDPFCYEFLLAMQRWAGVEASVNTSLNVGAPIAHTPEHAVATLGRARGMDGLLMIGDDGQALIAWLDDRTDARDRLTESLHTWAEKTGIALNRSPAAA